ncbi:hypothetical protein L0222_11425 [bacterium]|nr:hypothetical protein [bacterium]MCI0606434.1 hypothetical protein [bacterium]
MKSALVTALLLFSSVAMAQEDWTYINRDEKVNRFQVTSKGKFHLDGQEVSGFSLQQTGDKIAISPSSPGGKYAVLFAFGDEDSQCAILQYEKRAANVMHLEGTPMVWNSWSPEGAYLLLTTYSDAGSSLYSISLSTFQPKKVSVNLHKAGERTEIDTTTATWTSPDTFVMEASVYCDPAKPECTSQLEEKAIRIYKLTVNAESLQVTPEEQALPPEE